MSSTTLFHGMKRSGNHAILNWLNSKKEYRFFNDVIDFQRIVIGKETYPQPTRLKDWLLRRKYFRLLRRAQLYRAKLLVSLEDHTVESHPFVDLDQSTANILLVRDCHNLFSSRIRRATLHEDHPVYRPVMDSVLETTIATWKRHAREFLDETQHLSNKVTIYYNEWFKSLAYRDSICENLGISSENRDANIVSKHGGGSSFDGVSYDSKAAQMKVLERSSLLEPSEKALLDEILQDQELLSLQSKIDARVERDTAALTNKN